MPKKTYINVSGTWKEATNIWRNVSGTWKSKAITWRNISGTWKQCMEYLLTLSFGSKTYTTNTDYIADAYAPIDFDGWGSGDQLDVDIDIVRTINSGSPSFTVQYSTNSTSTWTTLGSWSTAGTSSLTVPNCSYNDTIRVRIYVGNKRDAIWASISAEITGGSWDSGSGTIIVGTPDTIANSVNTPI